jgi:hypothetical protein
MLGEALQATILPSRVKEAEEQGAVRQPLDLLLGRCLYLQHGIRVGQSISVFDAGPDRRIRLIGIEVAAGARLDHYLVLSVGELLGRVWHERDAALTLGSFFWHPDPHVANLPLWPGTQSQRASYG